MFEMNVCFIEFSLVYIWLFFLIVDGLLVIKINMLVWSMGFIIEFEMVCLFIIC